MPRTSSTEGALDGVFLDIRHRLIDIGAMLDRIDRAGDAGEAAAERSNDSRVDPIRAALAVLTDGGGGRAERIQMIFSDPYDPDWRRQ